MCHLFLTVTHNGHSLPWLRASKTVRCSISLAQGRALLPSEWIKFFRTDKICAYEVEFINLGRRLWGVSGMTSDGPRSHSNAKQCWTIYFNVTGGLVTGFPSSLHINRETKLLGVPLASLHTPALPAQPSRNQNEIHPLGHWETFLLDFSLLGNRSTCSDISISLW